MLQFFHPLFLVPGGRQIFVAYGFDNPAMKLGDGPQIKMWEKCLAKIVSHPF
jgi:hypothetical protein